MSRRPAAPILIPLLGLVVAAVLAISTGPSARAGAPPTFAPGPNSAPAQQQKPPAQPYGTGGWALLEPLPGVNVELPNNERFQLKAARIKRAGAALYPPNGKIYLLGGRMGIDGMDNPISFYDTSEGPPGPVPYTWLFEYTPGAPGTWTRKQASLDPCPSSITNSAKCPGERYTSNMAVATLTDTTGVAIYAIGGSSVSSIPTNRVRRYNPVADTMTYLDSDPWPATPTRVPGGYAVLNNKLYIFGGFNPRGSGAVYGDTWVFDPMAAAGSRWSQLPANLSTPRGYIAGVALDGYIYAIGGDTWQTNPDVSQRRLVPSGVVERLNPLLGMWEALESLPQPTGDLGAWAFDPGTGFGISGKLVAAGGHSSPPGSSSYLVPSNLAYMFDPPSPTDLDGAWSPFIGLTYPTRNFGFAALDGFLYAIGGYDYSAGKPDSAGYTQRFDANGDIPTTTPIPTSTNTSTPTSTVTGTPPTAIPTSTVTPIPSATSVACDIEFADVAPGSTFYPFVRCLACKGVLGGYPCGGPGEPCNSGHDSFFRPASNITRGQIAKIVSQSAGIYEAPLQQIYEDVTPDSPFYQWINRLSRRGYMSGYACGTAPTEPCGPDSLPYFRPNALATRGQLSKIVANAAELDDPVSSQTYADVPVSNDPSSFYPYIERLTQRNVMGGYPCGTTDPNSGPCDGQNRPYFRPANNVTRGQAAKIVSNTFFPNCQTP